MADRFGNELDWRTPALALTVWLAHFMLAWGISSIFPGERIVLWLTLALTVIASAALVLVWLYGGKPRIASFGGLALGIAALGVAYDFLPAFMA